MDVHSKMNDAISKDVHRQSVCGEAYDMPVVHNTKTTRKPSESIAAEGRHPYDISDKMLMQC